MWVKYRCSPFHLFININIYSFFSRPCLSTYFIKSETLTYIKMQQESPSASGRKLYSRKPKRKNDRSRSEGQKRPKVSMTSVNKAAPNTRCVFEIGPPAWIKEINHKSIASYLVSTIISLLIWASLKLDKLVSILARIGTEILFQYSIPAKRLTFLNAETGIYSLIWLFNYWYYMCMSQLETNQFTEVLTLMYHQLLCYKPHMI